FQDTDHLVYSIVVIHNYQHGEFLVSNEDEAMWIEEDTISEDALQLLFQKAKNIRTIRNHQVYIINWRLGNLIGQIMSKVLY
ncbi:32432_t:CDS:1, partial [Racocetra persica]